MTNPKGSHNSYITLSDAELYTRINQARKDERDTLISQIEEMKDDKKSDEEIATINEILNELREAK